MRDFIKFWIDVFSICGYETIIVIGSLLTIALLIYACVNACNIRRKMRQREIEYMETLNTDQRLAYLQLREMRGSRKALQNLAIIESINMINGR